MASRLYTRYARAWKAGRKRGRKKKAGSPCNHKRRESGVEYCQQSYEQAALGQWGGPDCGVATRALFECLGTGAACYEDYATDRKEGGESRWEKGSRTWILKVREEVAREARKRRNDVAQASRSGQASRGGKMAAGL